MEPLFSAETSKQMDIESQSTFGIPGITLMEDASFSAYQIARRYIESSKRTLFVAGSGNNGGDAIAMARLAYLDGFKDVAILAVQGQGETDLRATQLNAAQRIGIQVVTDIEDAGLEKGDLLVDGLFGIGLKGAPRAPYDGLISRMNAGNFNVISLDVPSGIGDSVPFGCAVKANLTICMGALKTALFLPKNRDYAGQIMVTFPFFPEDAKGKPDAMLLSDGDLKRLKLEPSSYKKTRGSLAIIGGSGRFTGAVVLAAKAAFHTGVGLVTVFTEERLIPHISKAVPSAMVSSYDKATDLDGFDAVLCGPGMGSEHDSALQSVLSKAKSLVVDADGIRAFSRLKAKATCRCILTPHLGEYAALLESHCPESDTSTPQAWMKALEEVQISTGATLVVKANTVIIKDSEHAGIVDGQNPSLGVAGSGDVLAGTIAALLAMGDGNAAENGVILHQKAGRLAQMQSGFYSSDELIGFLGKA